jgi:hypothetical protein
VIITPNDCCIAGRGNCTAHVGCAVYEHFDVQTKPVAHFNAGVISSKVSLAELAHIEGIKLITRLIVLLLYDQHLQYAL